MIFFHYNRLIKCVCLCKVDITLVKIFSRFAAFFDEGEDQLDYVVDALDLTSDLFFGFNYLAAGCKNAIHKLTGEDFPVTEKVREDDLIPRDVVEKVFGVYALGGFEGGAG